MDNFISQYITSIPTQIQEVKYGYVGELNLLHMRDKIATYWTFKKNKNNKNI